MRAGWIGGKLKGEEGEEAALKITNEEVEYMPYPKRKGDIKTAMPPPPLSIESSTRSASR